MEIVNCHAYPGKTLMAKRRNAEAAGVIYCGRGTAVGNKWSHLPSTAACYRVATREEAIARYRLWLWRQLQIKNPAVLAFFGRLSEDSVLGCWCVPLACHGEVIRRAWYWLRKQKEPS